MKSRLLLGMLMASLLVCLLTVLYFLPLTVNDQFVIWISNHRFEGLNDNNVDLFLVSTITSHGSDGTTQWAGNGLEADVYIGNISFISLSDGIAMWANDSLNLYNYPLISENDHYSSIYLSVISVSAQGSKDGSNPVPISCFNCTHSPASAYVDLNQTEAALGIKGNESYRLSISMVIDYYLSIAGLPFHNSSPSSIMSEKNMNMGQIVVNCTDGLRNYAHIDFPYQEFPYSVTIPFVKTVIPFF